MLKVCKHIFSKEGFDVAVCSSGKKVMDYLNEGLKVDLIILDLGLPDISGLRLLEQFRAKAEYNSTPIIINSGYSHLKSDFISWLADAFVVKKPDIRELKETVKEILK